MDYPHVVGRGTLSDTRWAALSDPNLPQIFAASAQNEHQDIIENTWTHIGLTLAHFLSIVYVTWSRSQAMRKGVKYVMYSLSVETGT